jgi:hypothetical protein
MKVICLLVIVHLAALQLHYHHLILNYISVNRLDQAGKESLIREKD